MRWRAIGAWLLVCASVACSDSEPDARPAPADAAADAGPVCNEGEIVCSDDAFELRTCTGGAWQVERCVDQGKLCEAGACVDRWRYGSPKFDQCAADPRATPESLAQKAAYFEEISRRLHIHPKLGWLSNVELPCAGADCSTSGIAETEATYADVAQWDSGENDGLWSALYMGAEAYRWAVTKDPGALDTLKLLLESEQKRMRITGVPGIFTRQLIPPDVPGIACPTALEDYVPDVEKDDNQWVKVGSDGCLQYVDATSMAWVSSDVCGLEEFENWCFKDNVSEDEYAGHMFGLGAVAKLVDDPDVQARARDLLAQVGDHLIEHGLEFHDWDGRVTEHGKIWAWKIVPGYNAAMALSFIKTIALATGDAKYQNFYDDCLLQKSGPVSCIPHTGANDQPYDQILAPTGLNLGCKANWNNYSMYMLSLHGLLWGETDPKVADAARVVLETEMWNPQGEQRPLSEQNNAFFDFIYAAGKALGPDTSGPALDAVANGICMLRQFPAHKIPVALDCPASECVEVCKDRFDQPMTDYPRPIAERCLARFVWWGSPYTTSSCTANARFVYSPADYLVAYWMGRYYGFIEPDS